MATEHLNGIKALALTINDGSDIITINVSNDNAILPKVPVKMYSGFTPSDPLHLITKAYADSLSTTVADASETVKGKVELATAAETTTGTSNTLAVHPAGLKVELDKKLPTTLTSANIFVGNGSNVATGVAVSGDVSLANTGAMTVVAASETAAGKVELTTAAETTTGTATDKAVHPAGLKVELDKKLGSTLNDGQILVGNGSNVATGVAMSGDTTIANTGAITVIAASATQAGKVELSTDAEATTGTSTNIEVPVYFSAVTPTSFQLKRDGSISTSFEAKWQVIGETP